MGKFTVERIASDVAALLGENLALECISEESPFPDLKDRVRILAPGILAGLLEKADTYVYETAEKIPGQASLRQDGSGLLPLPSEFLKLVCLKMPGWTRPVSEVSGSGSIQEAMQQSKWPGIRGTTQRPVVLNHYEEKGQRALLIYPCGEDTTPEISLYIPLPAFDEAEGMTVEHRFYPELVRLLAEKINAG